MWRTLDISASAGFRSLHRNIWLVFSLLSPMASLMNISCFGKLELPTETSVFDENKLLFLTHITHLYDVESHNESSSSDQTNRPRWCGTVQGMWVLGDGFFFSSKICMMKRHWAPTMHEQTRHFVTGLENLVHWSLLLLAITHHRRISI